MSISTLLPLVEALPPAEKFQLMQILLTSLECWLVTKINLVTG